MNGNAFVVSYTEAATPAQQSAAAAIVSAFDPVAEEAHQLEIVQSQPVASTWYAGQQAAKDFVRLTPAQQVTQIDAMTLAQLRTVVKYLAIAVSMLIKERLL